MCGVMRDNDRRMETQHAHVKHAPEESFQMNTFHEYESVNILIQLLCMPIEFSEVCIFNP